MPRAPGPSASVPPAHLRDGAPGPRRAMPLTGIHPLTAVTARAADNFAFYTRVLGLRLVQKTVNQDDVSAYLLLDADARPSPGTDLTFFDWPDPPERRGANSIVRPGLRVP